jgi:hypothetical protein
VPVEQFACPVCSQVFEDENEDAVVKKVMEHVSTTHPEWGTKKPGKGSKPAGSRWWKRG